MEDLAAARQKQGFRKIEKCCEEARSDGLDWAWVDTCCIDKSSSAELSETINRMYDYYAECNVCYVYLGDVEALDSQASLPDKLAAMAKSKWAKRGWTLQELIAPCSLKFFSLDWKPITSKLDWRCDDSPPWYFLDVPMELLLQEAELSEFCVAERMSWASARETTRQEDIAYCLLGIFEVNISLVYGEGSKAFVRLQEEILNRHDDSTLLAWTAHSAKDEKWVFLSPPLAISPRQFACTPRSVSGKTRSPWTLLTPPKTTPKGLLLEASMIPIHEAARLYPIDIPERLLSYQDCVLMRPDSSTDYGQVFLVPVASTSVPKKRLLQVYIEAKSQHASATPTLVRICDLEYILDDFELEGFRHDLCYLGPPARNFFRPVHPRMQFILFVSTGIREIVSRQGQHIIIRGLEQHPLWQRTRTRVTAGSYGPSNLMPYQRHFFGISPRNDATWAPFGVVGISYLDNLSLWSIAFFTPQNESSLQDTSCQVLSADLFQDLWHQTLMRHGESLDQDCPQPFDHLAKTLRAYINNEEVTRSKAGTFYESRFSRGDATLTVTLSSRNSVVTANIGMS